MGTVSKEFAETLLKRVQDGKHINTTVHEEEQLIRGWLYWHEHYYEPRLKELIAAQTGPIASGGAGAAVSNGALGKT